MGIIAAILIGLIVGLVARLLHPGKDGLGLIMTALLGINVDRTISLTFMIGAALAAVAGVMVTAYYGVVDFYIGFVAGIKAFTAAVLGGVGSFLAVVGE